MLLSNHSLTMHSNEFILSAKTNKKLKVRSLLLLLFWAVLNLAYHSAESLFGMFMYIIAWGPRVTCCKFYSKLNGSRVLDLKVV